MAKKFKIYALICPVDKKIRYIGKSANYKQRFKDHIKDIGDSTSKKVWISQLKSKGLIPILTILDESDFEVEARILENEKVVENIATVYNIFMPGKNTPTVNDYRNQNNIKIDLGINIKTKNSTKFDKIKTNGIQI